MASAAKLLRELKAEQARLRWQNVKLVLLEARNAPGVVTRLHELPKNDRLTAMKSLVRLKKITADKDPAAQDLKSRARKAIPKILKGLEAQARRKNARLEKLLSSSFTKFTGEENVT